MLRILITVESMKIGGIQKSLLSFLNSIDYEKYNVDLLVMEDGVLSVDIPRKVNVIYYKDYMLKPYKWLYSIKKMLFTTSLYDKYRFAFKKKYDISIAYDGSNNYIDMVAASVKSKKKIIWVHSDFKYILDNKNNKFNKFLYNSMSKKYDYFDQIVCVSKYVKLNIDSLWPKYKDKTIVINNLVDGQEIKKLAKEKTTINLGEEYNIVAMGKLTKDKNFNKLINLHKGLIDTGYNVKTYIIGDGKESYNLAKQIRNLKLTNSIMMLGEMRNPYNVLVQANLFINMSSNEAFGTGLLECMILDVPFLSNINYGSRDIYENIMPLNGGIICNNSEMYKNIIKLIKKNKKHIDFDYNTYNNKIKKQIKELLNI